MFQWLRIHLAMQGTSVQSLVREEPKGCRATKPMCHKCWAHVLEHASLNYLAQAPHRLKTTSPRACALQQEKPQRETRALQGRKPPFTCSNEDPEQSNKLINKKKLKIITKMWYCKWNCFIAYKQWELSIQQSHVTSSYCSLSINIHCRYIHQSLIINLTPFCHN